MRFACQISGVFRELDRRYPPFPESAVRLSDRHAEQAHLAKLCPDVAREVVLLVDIGCDRGNLTLRKVGDRVSELNRSVTTSEE